MTKALITATIYGIIESMLTRGGFKGLPPVLFRHWSWYHIWLLLLFTVIAAPNVQDVLVMAVVEDIAYFVALKKWPHKGDWTSWLGGFYLGVVWIPAWWPLCLGLWGIAVWYG